MTDWHVRIPAAIEKGKQQLDGAPWTFLRFDAEDQVALTAAEVALAEALWEVACEETPPDIAADYPALRAFTEKIESVSSPVHRRS